MATKKLTKHQKELIKKFGKFRAKQKAKRAKLAHLREQIKNAYAALIENSDTLSDGQRLLEAARIKRLANSAAKKIG